MIKRLARAIYLLIRLPLIALLSVCLRPRKLMPGRVERILIIRIDRLGDFVLTLPVIDNLRMHYPQARIDALVQPALEEFAQLTKISHGYMSWMA